MGICARFSVLSAVLLSTTACAHMESRAISYEDGPKLFVWKSNYSAGISNGEGICAQGALTAEATSATGSAGISNQVLGVINPALLTNDSPGNLIDLAAAQNRSVTLVNATNNQTAFANIAFFYLCQISLNQSVADETIETMWMAALAALPTIGTEAGTVSTLDPVAVDPLPLPGNRTQPPE